MSEKLWSLRVRVRGENLPHEEHGDTLEHARHLAAARFGVALEAVTPAVGSLDVAPIFRQDITPDQLFDHGGGTDADETLDLDPDEVKGEDAP